MAISGRFPRWKPAATESRYQPTAYAGSFSVSIIHRTLTCATGSLTCSQTLMHAKCTRSCRPKNTTRESLHWKLTLGEKIPCRTRGIEPSSPGRRSDARATELHPHLNIIHSTEQTWLMHISSAWQKALYVTLLHGQCRPDRKGGSGFFPSSPTNTQHCNCFFQRVNFLWVFSPPRCWGLYLGPRNRQSIPVYWNRIRVNYCCSTFAVVR